MKHRAPAKINLSLKILGKREDGFHEIETLIAPITLADELTIETSMGRDVRVQCDDPLLPRDDSNIAGVAVRQFCSHTGLRFAAKISISKHIPHGAGLGGGSSDAAAVLRALDSIFKTEIGAAGLESIAANIGSDVPFFIRSEPAWCRGRGEKIEETALPGSLHFLLMKPPFAVETPWAYKHWAGSMELPKVPYSAQTACGIEFVNDLERPVFEKFLLVPHAKQWLLDQPETLAALMSGSGSTVFAACETPDAARRLEVRVKEAFGGVFWTCVCETRHA